MNIILTGSRYREHVRITWIKDEPLIIVAQDIAQLDVIYPNFIKIS